VPARNENNSNRWHKDVLDLKPPLLQNGKNPTRGRQKKSSARRPGNGGLSEPTSCQGPGWKAICLTGLHGFFPFVLMRAFQSTIIDSMFQPINANMAEETLATDTIPWAACRSLSFTTSLSSLTSWRQKP